MVKRLPLPWAKPNLRLKLALEYLPEKPRMRRGAPNLFRVAPDDALRKRWL